MNTKLFVLTHKKYPELREELYTTLHVGRAISSDLGYLGDNTGDHISSKNKSFCELTGIYWLWKNYDCDIIGITHYRRFFTYQQKVLTQEYIEDTLQNYDIIVGLSGQTYHPNLYEHYRNIHHIEDLKVCEQVLATMYPDFIDAFHICMNCNLFTLGNMMICSKKIFDEYCDWLFPLLFEVERQTDISQYDDFQKRLYGYLSERLLRVWLLNSNYKIYEAEITQIE